MGRPDRRLRVLHVVEAVEAGVVRHVVDLVTHVDAEHHVAHPERRRGGHTDATALRRLDEAAATHRVAMARAAVSGRNAVAVLRVRRLIGRLRPDVVHGHSTVGGAVARLAAAGTATPVVYTPNGLSPQAAARVAERLLGPLTSCLVATSAGEAELARSRHLVPAARIVVVPNGIDPEPPPDASPPLAERIGAPPTAPVVATIGRLSPQKDPATVIEAWSRLAAAHPDAHFVWIGDGELRADAASAVAASPAAARIHLLGHVDGAASLLSGCTAFTLGSRFEGGPYAPLEAMRAGVPVVATDVVGTRDCVTDGHTGLLVPPGDAAALADATDRLLRDPASARRLAEAGRRAVRERFSVHLMARHTSETYRSVAGGGA